MSVKYRPALWSNYKLVYDLILIVGIVSYLAIYMNVAPMLLKEMGVARVGTPELRIRAFGSCAYILLHIILIIGPLARLDRRFLPLLYNRRHFGVMLFLVALAHAANVQAWYQAFTPVESWAALLVSNTHVTSWHGFPFEYLGILALGILFMMAATSHDFWLSFLGAGIWKALHMGVYVCYTAVVLHVTLGLLQSERDPVYAALVIGGVVLVVSLHIAAALKERRHDRAKAATVLHHEWEAVARVQDLPADGARTAVLSSGERVAVIRHGNKISVISNLCAHQNGPLGEGRVLDGCITCPWHGFQYDPERGASPPPFTEKVPTYNVHLEGDRVLVDPAANPPGTWTKPILLGETA